MPLSAAQKADLVAKATTDVTDANLVVTKAQAAIAAAQAELTAAQSAVTDANAELAAVNALVVDVPPTPVPVPVPVPPKPVVSPDGFTVSPATDVNGVVWSIVGTPGTPGAQIAKNGVVVPPSNNIKTLYVKSGIVYFENNSGIWYTPDPAGVGSSTVVPDPTVAPAPAPAPVPVPTPTPTPTPAPTGTVTFGGVTGNFKSSKKDTFKAPLDLTFWQKNRWDGGSASSITDEATNIPGSQADSSYSENNRIGADGLEMWITPQVDTASFPDKPFCGAHLGVRNATILPGMVVEIDLIVNVLGGGTWSGPVLYPRTKAGEIDWAEFGNTRTNKTPTANSHLFKQDSSGNWYQYGQDQTSYLNNPQLADGKTHKYRIFYHADGNGWSFWVDDKSSSNDKIQDPAGVPMSFWLELGVPIGENPGTGATMICSRYEEFVPA